MGRVITARWRHLALENKNLRLHPGREAMEVSIEPCYKRNKGEDVWEIVGLGETMSFSPQTIPQNVEGYERVGQQYMKDGLPHSEYIDLRYTITYTTTDSGSGIWAYDQGKLKFFFHKKHVTERYWRESGTFPISGVHAQEINRVKTLDWSFVPRDVIHPTCTIYGDEHEVVFDGGSIIPERIPKFENLGSGEDTFIPVDDQDDY